MRTNTSNWRFNLVVLSALFGALAMTARPAAAELVDPLADGPADPLFPAVEPAAPLNAPANQIPLPIREGQGEGSLASPQSTSTGPVAESKDPCAAVPAKPLSALGIGIAIPDGKLPTDLATPCWNQINQKESASRCWAMSCYNWNATCLCHRPLYFEEINLERYGYQCGDHCCNFPCECCLQPAASAAHFYGSVLALPYCMAADRPNECIYTLGHYRPGDCNPWRCHWPPWDPVAALTAAGVYTGLFFAIP